MCHTRVLQRTFHGPENPQFRFKQLARQEPAMQSNFACKSQRSFGESPSGPRKRSPFWGKAREKRRAMSSVRVLVGTRKGAFVLSSDGKRKKWKVSGPHFAGWEIYHMKGSPVDPNRIYASQTSGWFGQIVQRSDDGGKTWDTPGSSPEELKGPEGMLKGESNKFVYEGIPGTHVWYDGTQHPWEFKRVWHLEPSLDDPDHVYAG